ncbi:unnamed protein product [Paramecium sonneborni]|uniref:Transmembrane protein n=1 Tax=Paramecium sonneborni TaxID=65129 RepID=A0A8S1RPS4_9CILI|nr:unnamed protein product [Paramecium sonneborni]
MIEIDDINFDPEYYYFYGVWSKYNPLSPISQVGNIGIFNSNCFNIHNVINQASLSVSLLYYDCLDYNFRQITKTIIISDNEKNHQKFELFIDPLQYENVWYFFQILGWPQKRKIELIILQFDKELLHQIIQIKFPQKQIISQFSFGGDFIVKDSIIISLTEQKLLSYFPGKLVLQKFTIINQINYNNLTQLAIQNFDPYKNCQCKENLNQQISDTDIKWLDQKTYTSENMICNSFTLQGWLKIFGIVQSSEEFNYYFMKLSANFDNSLSNQNVSPFQFGYKITPNSNYLIFTTYKYTFPQVTIDFTENPFLIQETIEIQNNISLWHNLYIKQFENQIQINIKFFQESNIFDYQKVIEVRQFHCSQLKLQYGNYLQQLKNYLNIQIRNFVFLNCNEQFKQITCHSSCQECDGPTNTDCLSCSKESKRIYYPQFKTCLCPFNTTDELNCQSYEDSNLNLIKDFIQINCQYGYFELEGECLKCPSVQHSNVISCLECLQNPKNWSKKPYCYSDIFLSSDGSTQEEISQYPLYFLFTGLEVQICQNCRETNLLSIQEQYLDFQINSLIFKQFCKSYDYLKCYECSIAFCILCEITLEGRKCVICLSNYKLVGGQCTYNLIFPETQFCLSPYYQTSNKICKLCPLSNCKYCFEYSMSDLSKSTLYHNFQKFDQNEYIRIGCSLCQEGYIFNFNIGICEFAKPKIQNCLRSFINFNNQEICTLSSLDFNIAPEIINCQKYKPNCIQCVLSPESIIKCIVCEIGYASSIINGDCYQYSSEAAQIIIDGDWTKGDGWVQRIQSFMMQFLPNKYFYPQSQFNSYISAMIIECNQGYQLSVTSQTCQKYCSSKCLRCEEIQYNFRCTKCPLNYYQQPIRDQQNGQCSECAQLCQICKARSIDEIYKIQPSFIMTEDNQIYTKNCIQSLSHSNIVLDSYYNIARYCFKGDCSYKAQFEVLFSICEITRSFWPFGYEFQINTNYCNQMGIDTFIINFNFSINEEYCGLLHVLNVDTELKKKIFSLRKTIFKLSSPKKLAIQTNFPIYIKNFDSIEIINVALIFPNSQFFSINNNGSQVELKLINFTFLNSNISNIDSLFETQQFSTLNLFNVSILNTKFVNSSLFSLKQQAFKLTIKLITFNIFNCTFIDTNLIQLTNNFIMLIENLHIKNCQLISSSIFRFHANTLDINNLLLRNSQLEQNTFIQSYFLNSTNNVGMDIINFIFKENYLSKSVSIAFNSNLTLEILYVISNNFENSSFLSTLLILTKERIVLKFAIIELNFNKMRDAELLNIFSNQQINNLILSITNLQLYGNQTTTDNNRYLFNIQCLLFTLSDVIISNVNDPLIFYIFDNYEINIQKLSIINSQVNQKIPLSNICEQQFKKHNNLFLIEGFFLITLQQILIQHQSSIDKSIIGIRSNKNYLRDLEGTIRIEKLEFKGNILLQQLLSQFFSLLAIESQGTTNIIINTIRYTSNCLHSYTNNPFQSFAGLLYINCKNGFVKINDMNCKQNAATNTSNSFLFIFSNTILFQNLNVSNNNILPQSFWHEYYNLEFEELYSQEQINQIVQSILHIENIGGAGVIRSQNFTCNVCIFENILVFKSSIFEITTQGEGYIELKSIIINTTLNNMKSTTNSSGCLSINSQNSKFNLIISDALFLNVQNRMASTILTIIPSNLQNQIHIQNIQIENCISLCNQIFKLSFLSQTIFKNSITIQNMKIIQKEMAWMEYFSKIGQLNSSEIAEITGNNNAILNFDGSQVFIKNFIVEGLYFSPIFKVLDAQKFVLFNCQIQDIQVMYPFDLIHYNQSYQFKSLVSFQNLKILNVSYYQFNQTLIQRRTQYNYQIKEGNTIKQQIQQDWKSFNFASILYLFKEQIQQGKSLIYLSSITNQTQIYLNFVQVNFNNCTYCSNGLIFFQQDNFDTFQIYNFDCNFNNIQSYGCLQFILKNKPQNYVKIINSHFLQNNGTKGIAILGINASFYFKQCQIMFNQASQSGGGLYFQLNGHNLFINQLAVLYNKAKEGGGIYLDGDNNLNAQNLFNFYLQFNKAESFGNNIVESPTHLSLNINNMEMMSQKFISNKTEIRILKMDPYFILDQEIKILTPYLMIPSNQQLQQYKIYLPKKQESLPYINQIFLTLKNSRDELLLSFNNPKCSISQTIVSNTSNKIFNTPSNLTLEYDLQNNNFDLKGLFFRFDPYSHNGNYLQIKFNCSSETQQKQLQYLIKARSFKCQLGEIHFENGCQICQSQQGFYSVQYDQQKCSTFDKQKFADITSNNIKLLEGYWRPHYLSDDPGFCFKNPKFCIGGWGVGNQLCNRGHIGALCEECDIYNVKGEGYYFKNLQNSECQACFEDYDSIIPFIITSLWSCISVLLTLKSIAKSNSLFASLKLREKQSKIIFKLSQDHQSILIKMFLNYLWIYTVIFTFNINFSFSFNFIENGSNTSYFMANNFDCYLSEYFRLELIYSKVFAMWILIIYQFIIIVLGSYIYFKVINSKFRCNIISHTSICLFIFNYAGIIKMLSSILSIRIISNLKYIQGDVSLRYDTEAHYKWIYYFVIPNLLFFGYLIPLTLFVFLYAQRNKLDSIRLRGHICYLFNEYNQNSYFWELIKLSKKAIMIFIITYFETNISLKATLLGLCLVFYQLIAVKNKPYIISKFNSLDIYSEQLCSISIFLAAAKYICEQQNDHFLSIALQVCLIICCLRLCQPYLVDIYKSYHKKYRVPFLKLLNKFLKLIKFNHIIQCLDNILIQEQLKELQLKRNLNKLRSLAKSQVTNKRLITSQFNSQWTYRFRQNSPDLEHKSLVPLVTD